MGRCFSAGGWNKPLDCGNLVSQFLLAEIHRCWLSLCQNQKNLSTRPPWLGRPPRKHPLAVEPKLSFGRANPKLRYFHCFRHLEVRHGASRKQMLTRFCQPPRPPRRPRDPSTALRGTPGAVRLRSKHERSTRYHATPGEPPALGTDVENLDDFRRAAEIQERRGRFLICWTEISAYKARSGSSRVDKTTPCAE
jgi:hypothetical protein